MGEERSLGWAGRVDLGWEDSLGDWAVGVEQGWSSLAYSAPSATLAGFDIPFAAHFATHKASSGFVALGLGVIGDKESAIRENVNVIVVLNDGGAKSERRLHREWCRVGNGGEEVE